MYVPHPLPSIYPSHSMLQLESIGVSKLGTPWHNEYVFFVHFTEGDSPKITKMKEFVNSAVIASFAAEQAKKREELAGQ